MSQSEQHKTVKHITPASVYKYLIAEYVIYFSIKDNSNNLLRRANIYAVKNTWRRYNECKKENLNDTNSSK